MTDFGIAELQRTIESCVGQQDAADVTDASADAEFTELGLDSLVVFEVATRLQDDLGIRISDDELEGTTTPRALIALVNDKRAGASR